MFSDCFVSASFVIDRCDASSCQWVGRTLFFFEAVCSTGEITLLIEKRKDSRMDEELLMKEGEKKGRQTVSVLYVYDSSSALSAH